MKDDLGSASAKVPTIIGEKEELRCKKSKIAEG
jgi:hypothetical protein